MSHQATNWAIRQKGLKPATKIVLWNLADRHNPDGGCFPMQKNLAVDCEMSRSTLNLHLDKLQELGLIRREASVDQKTKQQRPTRYFLAFEDVNPVSDNRTQATKAVSENTAIPVSECQTQKPKAVSEKQPKPCPNFDDSRVLNSDTNSVREPLREPVSEEPPLGSPAKKTDKARLPDDWALSDEGWAYAKSKTIPDQEIEDEARGFHAYWSDRTDAGGRKSARGWEQCWAGWCRRIAPRYVTGRGMAVKSGSAGHGQGGGIAGAAARRWAARPI